MSKRICEFAIVCETQFFSLLYLILLSIWLMLELTRMYFFLRFACLVNIFFVDVLVIEHKNLFCR